MFFYAIYFIQYSTMLKTDTVNSFTGLGFSLEKLFIVIQVEAKSWKNEFAYSYDRWSYTHVSKIISTVF